MTASAFELEESPSKAMYSLWSFFVTPGIHQNEARTAPTAKLVEKRGDVFVANKWLAETLAAIQQCKADIPNCRDRLRDAEYLAGLFASWPEQKKPVFVVDANGDPSFAQRLDGFYLHLTVDAPGRLSWYASANGAECLDDDYKFDGSALPAELETLVA